jgi:hypothetical protein
MGNGRKSRAALGFPLLLASLYGCVPPRVEVLPVASGACAPAKAPSCTIEFFEIETLQRPTDPLAELRDARSASPGDPGGRELLRLQACALGADAIVGLHKAVSGDGSEALVGTAVRYR